MTCLICSKCSYPIDKIHFCYLPETPHSMIRERYVYFDLSKDTAFIEGVYIDLDRENYINIYCPKCKEFLRKGYLCASYSKAQPVHKIENRVPLCNPKLYIKKRKEEWCVP